MGPLSRSRISMEYSRDLNDECDRWLKKARMLLVEAYAKPKKLAPRRK